MRADGDEVGAGLGIIVAGQADGMAGRGDRRVARTGG